MLTRAFVQFIMNPVAQLARNIMDGNLEKVWKMINSLGIKLKNEEKEL